MSTRITRTNKDLTIKYTHDFCGERHPSIRELNLPRFTDCIPTNLPSIESTDYTCDRVYKLADGSYLLLEFESEYRKKNFLKYMRYVPRILEAIGQDEQLRLLVVYTADVQSAPARSETTCLTLDTEQAFLSKIPGDLRFAEIRAKVESGKPLNNDNIIDLAVLPLSYKGTERKQQAIDEVIDILSHLENVNDVKYTLSMLATANNKYLTQEQIESVERMLTMTRLGKAIYEDLIAPEVHNATRNATITFAHNLFAMGQDVEFVSKATGLSESEVTALLAASAPFCT